MGTIKRFLKSKNYLCIAIIISFLMLFFHWIVTSVQVKTCYFQQLSISSSLTETISLSDITNFETHTSWVRRANLSYHFDWTWHRNGEYDRYSRIKASNYSIASPTTLKAFEKPLVVNDAKLYLRTHPQEGFIVDDFLQLSNPVPYPLPIAKDLNSTCYELNLLNFNAWLSCVLDSRLLAHRMPATTHSVTVGIFNAFVDPGSSCGPPGTVYSEYATYHFQQWSTASCHNSPIFLNHTGKAIEFYDELLDSVGVYLSANGHFATEQLPRLLRLLAVAPISSKVLVAKGGTADQFMDILVERGIVTRERIIFYDQTKIYAAKIVYRSETWPYLPGDLYGKYVHDRTDMETVHRALIDHDLPDEQRIFLLVVKRKSGGGRSLINHDAMIDLIAETLQKFSKVQLKIKIFTGNEHLKEQIKMWQKSKVVIAPHGAGLLHVMWMKPGSFIIEIGYDSGMPLPEMYFEMSSHCKHKYWLVKAKGGYDAPLFVNLTDLQWAIVDILQQISTQ